MSFKAVACTCVKLAMSIYVAEAKDLSSAFSFPGVAAVARFCLF